MTRNHKGLDVWNSSVEMAVEIYNLTILLPPEEKYGISAQMKSAAVSIASNIAEGAARGSKKDFIRFLNMAAGSASELDTQLEILLRIELLDKQLIFGIKEKLDKIGRMIQGLIRSLR